MGVEELEKYAFVHEIDFILKKSRKFFRKILWDKITRVKGYLYWSNKALSIDKLTSIIQERIFTTLGKDLGEVLIEEISIEENTK